MLNSVSPGSLILRTIGEDLGHAVRGFRKALNGEDTGSETSNKE